MAGTDNELQHASLHAKLIGVRHQDSVQYRGIQYGSIAKRFALPQRLDDSQGQQIDCTQWGPRCPQLKYDVGHLLREPEGNIYYSESEDEFKCLNLDVTVPMGTKARMGTSQLPVLLWVHGGSQIISYGNAASKIGDVTKLMQDSIEHDKPMIIVTVQYRLNIFHVGDGQGTKNLGLKDLQLAVKWVHEHIAGFGGNPGEITLAGESAGAALAHAMLVSGVHVKRAILMSGSMYMSGPQPEARAKAGLIDPVLAKVKAKGHESLQDVPVKILLEAQAEVPIVSVFLQQDPELADWQTKTGEAQQLMTGDCEFESVLWRNGIESMTAQQIVDAFDKAGESSTALKKLYHINASRPTPTKHGALDFINDRLWAWPTFQLQTEYRKLQRKCYTYLFDQANPWQASSRAHHAVDLVYLFGGFDLSHNPAAEGVGKEMRNRFITFINGEEPWPTDEIFTFGPLGQCKPIAWEEVKSRRRINAIDSMKESMAAQDLLAVIGALVAGRISLNN